jgi:hypothetical protein
MQHALLSSLPCHEVVTTNVDLQFEKAAEAFGSTLSVLPARPAKDADRWLLKLHGSVDEPGSLVFTRTNYLDASFERGALFGIVQAMLLTRHMCFVGYSLSDDDFHSLVHEVRRALRGYEDRLSMGTTITLFEDPVAGDLWADELDVISVRPQHVDQTPEAFANAGRDVERFLDLVGFLAADLGAFVLDDSYEAMLSTEERGLRDVLQDLTENINSDDRRPGWTEVAAMLQRLGAPAAELVETPVAITRVERNESQIEEI